MQITYDNIDIGRGLGDQTRWLLAATNVSFHTHEMADNETMVTMAKKQLWFGQLPLLQIGKQPNSLHMLNL